MDIAPDIDRAPARPAGGFAKPSAEQDQRTLVITRTLNAPRELVFEAWSRPEHWVKWWGTLPHCEQEVRVRGAFRFCMRAPDPGSGTGAMRDHWVRGEYTYIDPPSRLIFTWLREEARATSGAIPWCRSPWNSAGSPRCLRWSRPPLPRWRIARNMPSAGVNASTA